MRPLLRLLLLLRRLLLWTRVLLRLLLLLWTRLLLLLLLFLWTRVLLRRPAAAVFVDTRAVAGVADDSVDASAAAAASVNATADAFTTTFMDATAAATLATPICRLQALAPELRAREEEVNSLRERVRAELDAARQLAATAAADRAEVRAHARTGREGVYARTGMLGCEPQVSVGSR